MTSPATQLLLELFESTPHVMICVKGSDSRYIAVNDAFVRRTACRSTREIVGKRAGDFFPRDLAIAYEAQDQSLLRTGLVVRNQLEIITDRAARREWFLTTKLLHHDTHSDGVEIVAVSTQAQIAPRSGDTAPGLRAALELAMGDRLCEIGVDDLASAARMTTDQLERTMRRVLATSPKQYLMRARVERAALLLATTNHPIAVIVDECGYYDQSQLTRYFKAAIGQTPGEYRRMAEASS